jgi:hypothetical protein
MTSKRPCTSFNIEKLLGKGSGAIPLHKTQALDSGIYTTWFNNKQQKKIHNIDSLLSKKNSLSLNIFCAVRAFFGRGRTSMV